MSTESERVSVQTYVSAKQRGVWRTEADELDMSQAEYVRSMVQAGRRSFDLATEEANQGGGQRAADRADSADATPGVDTLEARVLDVLQQESYAGWDALLAGVTDDVEARLEETLERLQSADRIRYSGRHGGYTVVEDGG
jgi:hypothetical protein